MDEATVDQQAIESIPLLHAFVTGPLAPVKQSIRTTHFRLPLPAVPLPNDYDWLELTFHDYSSPSFISSSLIQAVSSKNVRTNLGEYR